MTLMTLLKLAFAYNTARHHNDFAYKHVTHRRQPTICRYAKTDPASINIIGNHMTERFFYHSFPRRGANSEIELEKGFAILHSIINVGLALIPEYLEFSQPTQGDKPRILQRVQRRACFTELYPAELSAHSQIFGHFSLEFDEDTVRMLGGLPVFYIPQPGSSASGSHLGTLLFSIASDAEAVISRINVINGLVKSPMAADKINVTTRFTNPDSAKSIDIDRDETSKVFDMIGNAVTPWNDLAGGMDYLLNMFYPADDVKRGRPLDYYRQREWRIAGNYKIEGRDSTRPLTAGEKTVFNEIDKEFFFRPIKAGFDDDLMIDKVIVLAGFGGKNFIQLARRVIVPTLAVNRASEMLSTVAPNLEVIGID